MNLNLNWRVHGVAAVALVVFIVVIYGAFFVLGEGFAFGVGAIAGNPIMAGRMTPKIVIGSGRFNLHAGQAVHVKYSAQIGEGCVRIYMHRLWPYSMTTFSNEIQLTSSGAGEGDLIAPTDGWYSLKIYTNRPTWCGLYNHDESVWQNASHGASATYNLSWQVQRN